MGASLMVQWLRLCTSTAGGQEFHPWLGELRSCMPCCEAKKKKNEGWMGVSKQWSSLTPLWGQFWVCLTDLQSMSIHMELQLPVAATFSSPLELSGMFLSGLMMLDISGMTSQIICTWKKKMSLDNFSHFSYFCICNTCVSISSWICKSTVSIRHHNFKTMYCILL